MDRKGENKEPSLRNNSPVTGRGIFIGVAAIILLAAIFIFFLTGTSGSAGIVPQQTCAVRAIAYVNANLVQDGTSAELASVRETNGMYELTTRYLGDEIPIYVTRDCTLLFTDSYVITLSGSCETGEGTCSLPTTLPTQTAAPPVPSARPMIELYVMSFCPYGVQMEQVMAPVIGLLKDSIDLRVRYIASVEGDSIATAQSMHGSSEAVEDVRQLCIAKYASGSYWNYLAAFNTQCYPVWNNAERLAACQQEVTARLGINGDTIDRCTAGQEGLELLRADETMVGTRRVTSSPTLIINGQVYSGARTPDAIKQAICGQFDVKPSACDIVLSSEATSVSGNC